MTDWAPATEAEAAMREALRADDQELYFRVLARVELLLPISSEAIAGRVPMGWGTWTVGERTHVLAFTSSEAMHACLAEHAGSARKIPYYELAAAWPNLEWWLAVNPGLPIEGYLPAWFVSQLARGDVRLPGRTAGAQARVERAETLGRARATVPPQGRSGMLLEGQLANPPAEQRPPGDPPPSTVTAPSAAAGAPPANSGRPAPPVPGAAPAPGAAAAPGPEAPAVPVPGDAGPGPGGSAAPPEAAAGAGAGTSNGAVAGDAAGPAGVAGAVRPEAAAGTAEQPGRAVREEPEQTVHEEPGQGVREEPAPGFDPANDLEAQLLAAASSGSPDSFLSILLLAKVLLPVADGADPAVRPGEETFVWRTERLDDRPRVVVYTSSERMAEHLGEPVEVLAVRFMQLIRVWPDDSWSLAVNPGTPVGASLPGTQILGLASSAAEVGLADDAGAAGESGATAAGESGVTGRAAVEQPVPMQKVVAPSQVGWYLDRSYDRVSGFVHREQEVAHLRTPAKLVNALGLRYEGSPFDPESVEVYVLRWLAYRPTLYRIPYGGRTEAAMAAMEGWVIERAPFRGNGFAPADSEDVVAEFKVDSVRLPHGAQLWRLRVDGSSQLVALLDADGPSWRKVEES